MTLSVLIFSLFFSATLLLGIVAYVWRDSRNALTNAFVLSILLAAGWAFTYGMDLATTTLEEKILWMRMRFVCLSFLPFAWLLTILHHLNQAQLLTRPRQLIAITIPCLTIAIIWLSSDSTLFRYNFHIQTIGDIPILRWQNGPWYWVYITYSYLIFGRVLFMLVNAIRQAQGQARRQSLMITLAIFVPLLADALYQANLTPLPGYNFAPNFFVFTGGLLAWALFRYQLFNLMPVAHATLFANLQDCLFVLDRQNRILEVNPAALTTFGLKREAVIGHPAPRVFARWQNLVEQFAETLSAHEEVRILNQRGQTEYWEMAITPLEDDKKRINGRMLILHNITARKLTEFRLSQFFQAVEQSPATVVITDPQGHIEYVNRKFTELTGYSPAEALGQKTNILKSGETPPEEYARLWAAIKAGQEWRGEFHNRKKNGELYWESALITPVHDAQGHISHFLALKEDITAQKAAQAALQKSDALYSTLVQSLPIAIFSKELTGHYTFANQLFAQAAGAKLENILGHTDHDFIPKRAEQFNEVDLRVIQYGYPYEAIEQHRQPDGSMIYIQVIKVPIRDHEDKIIGIQGLIWDITDSKRVEVEVKQRLNELATITAISQAAASQLDLETLIDLVGEKILDLFDVQAAFIALYDKTSQQISFPFLQYFNERTATETLDFGSGLTSRVLESGKPLIITSGYLERSQILGAVNRRTEVREEEMPRSWVGIPILANNEAIGVISVQDFERENAFNDSDVRLLTVIAANVGIAIQNARLYADAQAELAERTRAEQILQRRVSELNLVNEISRLAAAHLDLEQLIALVGPKLEQSFNSKSVFIALLDTATQTISVPFWTIGYKQVASQPFPLGRGLTSIVLNTRTPLLIAEDFEKCSQEMDAALVFVDEYGYPKTWLGVPMLVGNEAIGAISVQDYDQEHAYGDEDVHLLMTIAANIGIALQNAQLYENIQAELGERKRAEAELQKRLSEIQALQGQLREQAIRDPLTNLFNRRYMRETLARELARAQREHTPLGVIIMDIDHFKSFNDTYGHATGDNFLLALGELLRALTRASDVACRYGGEEFVVLMPRSDLASTQARAELIRQKFSELRLTHEGRTLHGTISLGVALYPLHGTTGEEVLKRADTALYAAKADGRNRVVVSA